MELLLLISGKSSCLWIKHGSKDSSCLRTWLTSYSCAVSLGQAC